MEMVVKETTVLVHMQYIPIMTRLVDIMPGFRLLNLPAKIERFLSN